LYLNISFGQTDTLEPTQLQIIMKNNDNLNRKFCKIDDTIPFTGYLASFYPDTRKIQIMHKLLNLNI
jgi:hypothetical protein